MFSSLKSTWSYENRVSKHFVIFLNFPCLRACLLCCLLMTFFFACSVVRDLCRSGCRQNYYLTLPPPSLPPSFLPYGFFPTHNSLLNTSDSYNLCEISARLKLVWCRLAVLLDIGHLEKSFPESRSCKALRWDEVITIRRVCIV